MPEIAAWGVIECSCVISHASASDEDSVWSVRCGSECSVSRVVG